MVELLRNKRTMQMNENELRKRVNYSFVACVLCHGETYNQRQTLCITCYNRQTTNVRHNLRSQHHTRVHYAIYTRTDFPITDRANYACNRALEVNVNAVRSCRYESTYTWRSLRRYCVQMFPDNGIYRIPLLKNIVQQHTGRL